ncbi:MAG TPA: hypothetical protein VF789_18540 [Thermoanaerobaculia bacterium]
MKKVKPKAADELRPEYQRSDFGTMVRGKYAARIAAETNIVVLEPKVAKVFPNDKAVNEALRGLIKIAEATARPVPRSVRTRAKKDVQPVKHRGSDSRKPLVERDRGGDGEPG